MSSPSNSSQYEIPLAGALSLAKFHRHALAQKVAKQNKMMLGIPAKLLCHVNWYPVEWYPAHFRSAAICEALFSASAAQHEIIPGSLKHSHLWFNVVL